jgi:cellulose biosynthesis protein BcsQ
MIHFHEVPEKAFLCIRAAGGKDLRELEVTLVRDVYGRIQVVLDRLPESGEDTLADTLRTALERELGSYFNGSVWIPSAERDTVHEALVNLTREERTEWTPDSSHPDDPKWYMVERHICKSSWREPARQVPWPFRPESPAIVAFYSFKGGVGRTTALAVVAAILARRGYRVAVIDFDLEAPGVDTLLVPDAEPALGVLDYLLEKPLNRKGLKLRGMLQSCNDPRIVGDGPPISIVGAGSVDEHFIEKLARLDVERLVREDEGTNVLRDLFKETRSEVSPDLVLIDSRAGLHDLGGLAVAQVSHLAIVISTDSEQSYRGLREVVRVFGQHEKEDPVPVKVVQGLLTQSDERVRSQSRQRFHEKTYDIFRELYYREGEVPDIKEIGLPHNPILIDDYPALRTLLPWDAWNGIEPLFRILAEELISVTGRKPVGGR